MRSPVHQGRALLAFVALSMAVPGCGSDDSGDAEAEQLGHGAGGASGAGGGGLDGGLFETGLGDASLGGDGQGLADACAAAHETATRIPANILFVIDRSGSMNCNPPPLQTTAECEAA